MRTLLLLFTTLLIAASCHSQNNKTTKMKQLTPEEQHVIIQKGTERPFSGKYNKNNAQGLYLCKQCSAPLYRSDDKFDSGCGWPAFDDEIAGAVRRLPDADGQRTEITCARCGGHLGHLFTDEGLTPKNLRHCVNSISMEFVTNTAEAIFAGGCFWGVEHLMQQQKGVISVESGYIGGKTKNPTYEEVCSGKTGHSEAVRIIYDPTQVTYDTLARLFFEIHDPTQTDRQGPDVGNQYRSEVFYSTPSEKATIEQLITLLRAKGFDVKTRLTPASDFYPAEQYHQDYYNRTNKQPYCHSRVKRF